MSSVDRGAVAVGALVAVAADVLASLLVVSEVEWPT
jgi:hypothetical protein